MLKLLKQYKYLVFCILCGIILTLVERCHTFLDDPVHTQSEECGCIAFNKMISHTGLNFKHSSLWTVDTRDMMIPAVPALFTRMSSLLSSSNTTPANVRTDLSRLKSSSRTTMFSFPVCIRISAAAAVAV